ncbi:hypothetical protein NFC81_02020 [Salinispirillum sp. LH 10-3-1]|uniref:Uncharacterized protein n=1 Tax=Salinispirillum sp. LH 10-3-1 TaxID=2952525 RepID=A0AB38YGZ6_9GAMM
MHKVCRVASFWLLCCCALVLSAAVGATAPSVFDPARLLMQGQNSLSQSDVEEILGSAIAANIRVPAEHLGVAFYDMRSGQAFDRTEIRALMGAVRQDGAYELLAMVEQLTGGRLPLALEQLQDLMDAAYLASMRNPPAYIDIEFYDRRTGPTGIGGGVSGSTPEWQPSPPSSSKSQSRKQRLRDSRGM